MRRIAGLLSNGSSCIVRTALYSGRCASAGRAPDCDPTRGRRASWAYELARQGWRRGAGRAGDTTRRSSGRASPARATAIMLGRAGARVALIDQRPEASAYKRICTHYIQSSAVRDARTAWAARADDRGRRGALARPHAGPAGAGSSRRSESTVPSGVNLRRERPRPADARDGRRDPRRRADAGRDRRGAHARRERIRIGGVQARDRHGEALAPAREAGRRGRRPRLARRQARGGADEDGSARALRLRRLLRRPRAGTVRRTPSLWLLDPDMVAAFPTDRDLTFYAVHADEDRLPEFRRDPEAA